MSRRRSALRPPLAGEALDQRLLHEVVRDWPETLAVLRRRGVDVAAAGGSPFSEVEGADALARELVAATRWRPAARGPE